MVNQKLRNFLQESTIMGYEIAQEIKVSPQTLSLWMREELTGEHKEKVEKAVNAILQKRADAAARWMNE